jgi:hypothetical protein
MQGAALAIVGDGDAGEIDYFIKAAINRQNNRTGTES